MYLGKIIIYIKWRGQDDALEGHIYTELIDNVLRKHQLCSRYSQSACLYHQMYERGRIRGFQVPWQPGQFKERARFLVSRSLILYSTSLYVIR